MITPNIRGFDKWGAGYYNAPRGKRLHNGLDFVCHNGEYITSLVDGICTKIGYPYNPTSDKKGDFRYIEMTDKTGIKVRFFYLHPIISVGNLVQKGQTIGISQNLTVAYPGIIQHFHFEVKTQDNSYLNPYDYLLEK